MDFVERLKAEVASDFPFLEGEDFEEWSARVRAQPLGARVLLAAAVVKVGKAIDVEGAARKRAWIAAARLEFDPGPRKPCFMCGRFEAITQAHHVVPLGRQFDAGYVATSHEFEWLCPNHHVILHFHVDELGRDETRWSRVNGATKDITLREEKLLAELITRSVPKR